MNLKEQGFRLVVDTSRNLAKWIHPSEETPTGWIDCTLMDDEQFESLMTDCSHLFECYCDGKHGTQERWECRKCGAVELRES